MIFATDLDRTLIYHKRFLKEPLSAYKNIEIYKGEPLTYMSYEALKLLKRLHHEAKVVPITTRNYNQYHRIDIFKGGLEPELYIINNGGTIFYQGQEDREWTAHIWEQIKAMPVGYDEVLEWFLAHYTGPVKEYKKSDDLIWLILGDKEQIDWRTIQSFRQVFTNGGWKIDVNGRKIYLYPEFISKWKALEYIGNRYYPNQKIMAAGDSLFDYEMVHKADYGIVPRTSGIEGECKAHVTITQNEGLDAAEELLNIVLKRVFLEKSAN